MRHVYRFVIKYSYTRTTEGDAGGFRDDLGGERDEERMGSSLFIRLALVVSIVVV